MNEDKRYDAFPYIRGENIVKLVGGPLHNQYWNWVGYWGFREIRVMCPPPPMKILDWDNLSPYADSVEIKIAEYRLFRETFWIMHHGVQRLYGAYFTGFH